MSLYFFQSVTNLLHCLDGHISPAEARRAESPVNEACERHGKLTDALSRKCQELDAALVRSQGVQDALDSILAWLNQAENQFK